jgi:hypothetical protein
MRRGRSRWRCAALLLVLPPHRASLASDMALSERRGCVPHTRVVVQHRRCRGRRRRAESTSVVRRLLMLMPARCALVAISGRNGSAAWASVLRRGDTSASVRTCWGHRTRVLTSVAWHPQNAVRQLSSARR